MSDSPDRAAPQPLSAEEEADLRKMHATFYECPDQVLATYPVLDAVGGLLEAMRVMWDTLDRERGACQEALDLLAESSLEDVRLRAENERLAAQVQETINLLRAVEDRLMWDRDHMRKAGLSYGADGADTTRGHVLRFLEQLERSQPEPQEPTEYPKEEHDGEN